MKIRRRYKNDSKVNILLPLIFLFVLFLSVGYSSLNQELNITSEASFRLEEDIRITDIKLVGNTFNGIENYNSSYSKDRIKTGITLNESNSSITYQVTITNTGNVPMLLNLLENVSYNNDGITYELNKKLPYFINKGEEKKIELTYKWSSYNEKNKNLDAVIRFNFIKAESVLANGTDNATFINNGSFDRSKVESIRFMPTIEVPSSAIEVWDASLNKDGSVMAYTLDNDSNDLYELYIAGYGEIKLSGAYALFQNFANAKTIEFNNIITTNKIGNMNGMFDGCKKLSSLDLSSFDTSNIVQMANMFRNCKALTVLDLSNFNTLKVTTMQNMFKWCSSLQNIIGLNNLNLSKITVLSDMFNGCSKLVNLDISSWNAKNLTNINGMFKDCTSLSNLKLSGFSANNIVNMSGLFYNCKSLTSLDLSEFKTGKVTNMSNMFYNCEKITTLDLSNFDTIKVANMSFMFEGCISLISLNVNSFNTSNVINMQNMFDGCVNLENLILSNFITNNVTNMSMMFRRCMKLTSLDLSGFNMEKVEDISSIFNGCYKLSSLNLSNWNLESLKTNTEMFINCSQLKEIDFSLVNSKTYEKDIFKTMLAQIGNITFYVKDSNCKELLEAIKPSATVIIKV